MPDGEVLCLRLSAGRFDKKKLTSNPALKALYVDRVRFSRRAQ